MSSDGLLMEEESLEIEKCMALNRHRLLSCTMDSSSVGLLLIHASADVRDDGGISMLTEHTLMEKNHCQVSFMDEVGKKR